jgi:tRNA(fMet)-specific endonuclease VapC
LLALIADLLAEVAALDFDSACAEQFGKIRRGLLQRPIMVPVIDLMIASVAIVHNLTLVTHNSVDFQTILGLLLDDWLTPSMVAAT